MSELFQKSLSVDEVRALLERPVPALGVETVSLDEAAGRVAAEPVTAATDLPEWPRAVVDGYAVRASDTFGAAASNPAYLTLGEEVRMGEPALAPLRPGEAVRIATGGMVPPGADAVVMVEHAEAVGGMVEVHGQAAPGDGMVRRGDDLSRGSLLAPAGRRLRPQEVGLLAAAGVERVAVFVRPRVAVIPTGDELAGPGEEVTAGKIRDSNTLLLSAALRQLGAEPVPYPIVPDDPGRLAAAVHTARRETALTLVAGGSSVGARDWTLDVFQQVEGAEILCRAVALRPGKPLLIAAVGDRLLVGLPGHPVSSYLVLRHLLARYVRRLGGEDCPPPPGGVRARLTAPVASDPGKEDLVRVRLTGAEGGWTAEPIPGRSTLLATMAAADGIVAVPAGVEGLEAGEEVWVALL